MIQMLLVGYNCTRSETCIDYLAGDDPIGICEAWERVRGPQGFELVATWDADDLAETLKSVRQESSTELDID